MNSVMSSLQRTTSIFSPCSCSTIWLTRAPWAPMHAPTGSTFSSLDQTAILVRTPASRLMARISTVPSKISGTSISNIRLTSCSLVRLMMMRGPRSVTISSLT